MKKVFRFGGNDPRVPQWWVVGAHRNLALMYFQQKLGWAVWHELIGAHLEDNPSLTYQQFLEEFLEEETDLAFLQAVMHDNQSSSMLFHHGFLDIYKVGSYRGGCFIIAADESDAISVYELIAGCERQEDMRIDMGVPEMTFIGLTYNEPETEEWSPDVRWGFGDRELSIERPDGAVIRKTGKLHIKDALMRRVEFPYFLAYGNYATAM